MNYNLLFDKFPILETQRLILKPIEVENFDGLFAIYNDPDIIVKMNNGKIYSIDEAYYTITHYYPNLFYEKKGIAWGMFLKPNEELIGLRICFVDYFNGSVLIQGQILKKYRQKGLTLEGYIRIIEFLRTAEMKEITANCKKNNAEGIGLLKKLGFNERPLKNYSSLFRTQSNIIWYEKDLTTENTKLFNSKILDTPKTFNEAYLFANEKYIKKDLAFAEDFINKAIQIEPLNSKAYLLKGKILFSLKKYLLAIDCFKKVIEVDESCIEAYRELGICQYNSSQWFDAHESWRIAVAFGDEKAKELINEYVIPF